MEAKDIFQETGKYGAPRLSYDIKEDFSHTIKGVDLNLNKVGIDYGYLSEYLFTGTEAGVELKPDKGSLTPAKFMI